MASVPQEVYRAFTGTYYFDPSVLPAGEAQQVKTVLDDVRRELGLTGNLYSVNNWWWQGACVQASENRAVFLATLLPSSWGVGSYTHYSMLHTFNLVWFRSANGSRYHWRVDNYVNGIVVVDYIGTTVPWWMYPTPNNTTFGGGRPGGARSE